MAKLRIILALWLFCAINCDIALCMDNHIQHLCPPIPACLYTQNTPLAQTPKGKKSKPGAYILYANNVD